MKFNNLIMIQGFGPNPRNNPEDSLRRLLDQVLIDTGMMQYLRFEYQFDFEFQIS